MYKNPKIVNEIGGIVVQGEEGNNIYLDPGTDLHNKALNGDFGEVIPLIIDFSVIKSRKLSDLAALRYNKEIAGVIINNISMTTDRQSSSVLNAAIVRTMIDPNRITYWKTSDGQEVALDAPTIQFLGMSLGDYVQNCFNKEFELITLINAAETKEDLDAIDITIGWPSRVINSGA